MKIPQKTKYRTTIWGFSNGSGVKNLPVIVGDTGLIPDPERFHILGSDLAHVPQLLSLGSSAWQLQLRSPYNTTSEAHRSWISEALVPMFHERSHHNEKPMKGP